MKLSIIIPIYNTEKYLKDCIDSIQSFKGDYEVLLIDDGSKDSSSLICKEYISNNIRYIYKENSGVSDTRNQGIIQAKGEYIMFVDSDDYLLPNWNEIIERLKEKDVYYISKKIEEELTKTQLFNYVIGNNNKNIMIGGPIAKCYKRDFLLENNLCFNKDVVNGEDVLFNTCVLNKLSTFEVINKTIYAYRFMQGTSTKNASTKLIDSQNRYQSLMNEQINILDNSFNKKELLNFINLRVINGTINKITYIEDYSLFVERMKYAKSKLLDELIKSTKPCSARDKRLFFFVKRNMLKIIYIIYQNRHKRSNRENIRIVEI